MASLIIFFGITILVAYFLAQPILQARTQGATFQLPSNHTADDLVERKQTIYAAIKDIEFDYEMGKLSEEDFKELREQYKADAVKLLKEIDQTGLKKPRSGKARKSGKAEGIKFCWECGNPVTAEDKFCDDCGTKLV